MKDQNEIVFLVQESLDGGYEAKALGFPIFTEAETFDELKKMIVDAIKCHFESLQMPTIARLHLTKDEILAL